MKNIIPSIRVADNNPDHHLWNNHGTWWIHYTVHLPDYTKRRVRRSLGTANSHEARRLRDGILADLVSDNGLTGSVLSALTPRPGREPLRTGQKPGLVGA